MAADRDRLEAPPSLTSWLPAILEAQPKFSSPIPAEFSNPPMEQVFKFAQLIKDPPPASMHLTLLGIGSLGLLWAMLDSELDIRGANHFVRPYHVGGLFLTVITGVIVLAAMLRLFQRQVGARPALQTTLFFLTIALLWWQLLPMGDWLAEQVERSQKTAAEVGEYGYGWYYWDDSGMGGDPMSIGHILRTSILFPFIPVLWLTFVYLVLKLRESSIAS